MPRKLNTAILREEAFVALLTAALEVYPKETFGIILGSLHQTRYRSRLIIKNALTYQNAVRKKEEVSINPSQDLKIRKVINELSGYKIMGEFHSHTCGINYLSKHDKKDMIEDGERFSLLTVVEPVKKGSEWRYDKRDKSLHGTVNSSYKVTIKIYARDYESKRIKKLRIECPYISRLNRIIR